MADGPSRHLRYSGLDLPVYASDHPVYSGLDLELAPTLPLEQTSLLRYVFVSKELTESQAPLNVILQLGDRVLNRTAALCGARVVPHKWALQEQPGWKSAFLPPDYALVADTHIIRKRRLMDYSEAIALHRILKKCNARNFNIWRDAHTDQFSLGSVPDIGKGLWIHDLDLYVARINLS